MNTDLKNLRDIKTDVKFCEDPTVELAVHNNIDPLLNVANNVSLCIDLAEARGETIVSEEIMVIWDLVRMTNEMLGRHLDEYMDDYFEAHPELDKDDEDEMNFDA